MSSKTYKIIIGVLFTLMIIFMFLSFTSCISFKPIWIDQLPAECNMSLNTYKLHYKSKEKSATVTGDIYCYKKLHRLFCQAEVFGTKDGKPLSVDYNDPVKFRNFSQCMSELK